MTGRQTFILDRYFKLRGSGCCHKEALDIARAYAVKVYGEG